MVSQRGNDNAIAVVANSSECILYSQNGLFFKQYVNVTMPDGYFESPFVHSDSEYKYIMYILGNIKYNHTIIVNKCANGICVDQHHYVNAGPPLTVTTTIRKSENVTMYLSISTYDMRYGKLLVRYDTQKVQI